MNTAYQRAWRKANADKMRAYRKSWIKRNSDYFQSIEFKARKKKSDKKHRDKYLEREREKGRIRGRCYRETDTAYVAEHLQRSKDWQKLHPAKTQKNYKHYCEQRRPIIRTWYMKHIKDVSNTYARQLLSANGSNLGVGDWPQQLVEAKRYEIIVKRRLHENSKVSRVAC
jgi:hypothetical protein